MDKTHASRGSKECLLGRVICSLGVTCLLILNINTAALASGLVSNVSQIVTGWYASGLGNSQTNVFSTPVEACQTYHTSNTPDAIWTLVGAQPNPAPNYYCDWLYTYAYYILSNTTPQTWIRQTGSVRSSSGSAVPVFACPTGTTWGIPTKCCPVNSATITDGSAAGLTSCTCKAGYVPDASGTSCVSERCPVDPLTPLTDPVAQQYDNGTYSNTKPDLVHLTSETQAGLACIQQKVAALNCYRTPQPTSGYRPTAYQTHILEVYDKWMLIKGDNTPACAETKAAIKAEWDKHKPFARRPGVTSNHSQVDAQGNPAGNAVDISYVPDNVNDSADAIACQCNMYRPMINMPDPTKNDPVHYQPRTCPR